jgi:hypothetical protein
MTPSNEAPAQPPGFFAKYGKWLLAIGCLTPLLCCGGFSVLGVGIMQGLKSTAPFVQGLARANQSDEVNEVLGTPLKPGFMVNGSINDSNGAGTADFEVPVTGPKNSGTLEVTAVKERGGAWTFSRLAVQVDLGPRIDLLDTQRPEPVPDVEPLPDEPPSDGPASDAPGKE